MRRFTVSVLSGVLLLSLSLSSSWGQPPPSYLEPISPTDYKASTGTPPAIAVDNAGQALVVYMAQPVAGGPWRLRSLLRTGNGWQQTDVPMTGIDSSTAGNLQIRGLAARESTAGFHLLAGYGSKLYYWHRLDNTWSDPELVDTAGSDACGLALEPNGEPRIARIDQGKITYYFRQDGPWQHVTLGDGSLHDPRGQTIVVRPDGPHYLLAEYKKYLVLAFLPPGANPLDPDKWSWQPPPEGDEISLLTPVPANATACQYALTYYRELSCAAWAEGTTLTAGFMWVGGGGIPDPASYAIAGPAGFTDLKYRLVSDGLWCAGLLSYYYGGGKKLLFRWLSLTRATDPVELLPQPSPTEAAIFAEVGENTLNLCVDTQYIAHPVLVAKRSGETGGGIRRVWHGTVGGAIDTNNGQPLTGAASPGGEPPAQTGGTTAGAAPDFLIRLTGIEPARRYPLTQTLMPSLKITNQGAAYYGLVDASAAATHGDLGFTWQVEGRSIRGYLFSTSEHQQPLLGASAGNTYSLPKLSYAPSASGGTSAWPSTFCYGPVPAGSPLTSANPNTPLTLTSGLGRKTMRLVVDPERLVDEAQENNNQTIVDYVVVDGRHPKDKATVNGQLVTGLNDLAIRGTPLLHANTPLWQAGWLPQLTLLEVLVENPGQAEVFRDAQVEVYVDRELLATATIPALGRTLTLCSGLLGEFGLTGTTRRADLCGQVVQLDLPLQQVAPGQHQLDVVVDPHDKFADLIRDNNKYSTTFTVRRPGGTLNVQVLDHSTNAPLTDALVWIKEWYAERTNAQGLVQIPDVPAGTYPKQELSAQSLKPTAYYTEQHPAADFTVQAGATTDVTIRLMKACKVIGAAQNPQGQPITDEAVHVGLKGGYCTQAGSAAQFEIPDVLPGPRTFLASAYGYQALEANYDVTPDANYEYHLTLTLQPGPRGTVTGQVTDENGNGLKEVAVWLTGAPRSAETDAAGAFTLANVAANRSYELMAMKQGYTTQRAVINNLAANETRQVSLQLAKITYRRKELDFKVTTRAQVETSKGLGEVAGWKVTARHGMFYCSLGLLYHTLQRQDTVDQLVVGMEPGPFWWSTVATTWSPTSLISQNIKEVHGEIAAHVFSLVAGLVEQADPIAKVKDYLEGDLEHTELHDGGVVGTYVSTTSQEYQSQYAGTSLLDLSGGIPLAGQTAGGFTVVRADRVVVTDGESEKAITRQWRSPKMCIYHVDQGFAMDKIEVRVYLCVFNQHGAMGPLAGSSQNVITWRPKDGWAQMVAEPYQVASP